MIFHLKQFFCLFQTQEHEVSWRHNLTIQEQNELDKDVLEDDNNKIDNEGQETLLDKKMFNETTNIKETNINEKLADFEQRESEDVNLMESRIEGIEETIIHLHDLIDKLQRKVSFHTPFILFVSDTAFELYKLSIFRSLGCRMRLNFH